jgi:hypothetical protein
MHIVTGTVGLALVAIVLADAFQTVIVARQGQKIPAITRVFYRLSWSLFTTVAARIAPRRYRERYLGIYGPLSLLMLLGFWALGFIIGFAILQWSVGLELNGTYSSFATDLYFSAGSFFTLGSGEPQNIPSKYLMVLEAGLGFSFLGLVIGYLPVLYQSFSSRELRILDTASIFRIRPLHSHKDRLPRQELSRLCAVLSAGATTLDLGHISEAGLQKLRIMYEPHAKALATYFLMDLPPWIPSGLTSDNWQIASWEG